MRPITKSSLGPGVYFYANIFAYILTVTLYGQHNTVDFHIWYLKHWRMMGKQSTYLYFSLSLTERSSKWKYSHQGLWIIPSKCNIALSLTCCLLSLFKNAICCCFVEHIKFKIWRPIAQYFSKRKKITQPEQIPLKLWGMLLDACSTVLVVCVFLCIHPFVEAVTGPYSHKFNTVSCVCVVHVQYNRVQWKKRRKRSRGCEPPRDNRRSPCH